VYEKDDLYNAVSKRMKWGVLDKMIGRTIAKLMVKRDKLNSKEEKLTSHFTSGYDFI